MPINEFDSSVRPEYVSNRIQLPFAEIHAMAAKRQNQQDAAEAETYKLNDLVNSIPTINDPNLGLSNIAIKKTIDSKYAPRVQEVSNRIVNGGDLTALKDLNNLKREMANDPNIIEARNSALNYKAYAEDKAKKGDKYAVYKDIYRNQPLIDEQGNLKPFRYSGMGEVQDHASEARDQMKDIAKMGFDSKNSHLEADGNIYTKDSHGTYVKDSRIRDLANQKAYDFVKTEKGKDFLDLIKYENPNATSEQLHKRVSDYLFNAGSNQIFSNFGGGTDVKTTGLSARALDKKEFEDSLLGSPKEGITIDLTAGNKDYQDLKKDKYIQSNPDGTLKVDWVGLKSTTPKYYDSQGNITNQSVDSEGNQNTVVRTTSTDKLKKIVSVVKDIADKIGYTGEFKATNYEDIINKYNAYSKVRLADEQMTAPVSKIESEKATRNWNNYDVIDPNTAGLPMDSKDKPTIDKNDQLILNNWENSADGRMVRSGYILKYDDNGNSTQVPIKVRPKTIVDDTYHDRIAKVGLKAAEYEVSNIKPIREEGDGVNSPKIKVIDEIAFPGVADVEVFDTGDKKARYHVTPKDGSDPINFGTQAEFQQYILSKYYTKTKTGKSDAYYIAPKKDTFESTQSE